MQIRINRVMAIVLMGLLYPLVLVIRLVRLLAGRRRPKYVGTVEVDPLEYAGDKPILIAVWAVGASVWEAATAEVVEQAKKEFVGRCEFAYVEASSSAVTEAYGANIVPVLILRHRGTEVGRFVNTMRLEELRPAISAIAG